MTDRRSDRNVSGEGPVSDSEAPESAAAAPSNLTTDMQALIGRQLRAVYDDVAKQPVPDRFLELMKQLDDAPTTR